MSKKSQPKPIKQKSRKPVEKPIETYPQYENDDDIPVWTPDQPSLNKQNQIKIKNRTKLKQQEERQPSKGKKNKPQSKKNSKKRVVQQVVNDIVNHEDQEMEQVDDDLNYEDENNVEEGDGDYDVEEGQRDEEYGQGKMIVEGENNEGGEQQGDYVELGEDLDEQVQIPQAQTAENSKNDYTMVNMKIQQILAVLGNFQRLAEPGKSRKQYLEELKSHLQSYYNYNSELIDHFLTFFNPNQLIQFFEANQTQRPLTIRINTLKTRRKELAEALLQRGVDLDKLAEWSKVGIKIYQSKVPIGATPQYLAGHYMLQSASSLLPVLALDPQPNEKILDLAAAPGGKTTYIAQLMKNTGVIFANDVKKERLRALQFNVQRLGISNVIVTNYDGRKITKAINNFDRVLLDAPCTGLGIISKDQSIKANKVLMDIRKHSHLQKELLAAAIDSAKKDGIIVYSTCSVSPLQNEEVVNYALKRRHVKLVDIEVDVGEPGYTKYIDKRYHPDTARTRRIFPHVHNMDGFYVAKFIKLANGAKVVEEEKEDEGYVEEVQQQKTQKGHKHDKIKTKKIVKNKNLHNKIVESKDKNVAGRTERNPKQNSSEKKSEGKKFNKGVKKSN